MSTNTNANTPTTLRATAPVNPRPIPSRGAGETSSFIETDDTARILGWFMNNTSPEVLHKGIWKSLGRMSSAGHANLLKALMDAGVILGGAAEAVKDKTTRHCGRCHASYTEASNGYDACRIKHLDPRLFIRGTPAPAAVPAAPVPAITARRGSLSVSNAPIANPSTPGSRRASNASESAAPPCNDDYRWYYPCCDRMVLKVDPHVCIKDRHTTRLEHRQSSNVKSCQQVGCQTVRST
jgi:hypothetical protein